MSDSLKRLGRRIRHYRVEKGLSQERLAEGSGISSKYISDLERGGANVSIQVLEKVANVLSTNVIDLLDNEHEAERNILVGEINNFLETASDEKIKTMYRLMKSVS